MASARGARPQEAQGLSVACVPLSPWVSRGAGPPLAPAPSAPCCGHPASGADPRPARWAAATLPQARGVIVRWWCCGTMRIRLTPLLRPPTSLPRPGLSRRDAVNAHLALTVAAVARHVRAPPCVVCDNFRRS